MTNDTAPSRTAGGLPLRLPEGEVVLWQGRPDPWALAREAFGVKWVAVYFVAVSVWRVGTLVDLMPFWAALSAAIPFVLLGLAGGAILVVLAVLQARATTYTLTSARVVMQIGAALTLTLNLPHKDIESADFDRRRATGTIALRLKPGRARLSYLVAWPHVRPWRFNPTQPALRCIPDVGRVAALLAQAAAAQAPAAPETGAPGTAPVAAE